MKIYNVFGIKPTNTFVSAGTDYYVPNIDDFDFGKSYDDAQKYRGGCPRLYSATISD